MNHQRLLNVRDPIVLQKMNEVDSIYEYMTKAEIQVADHLKKLRLRWKYQFPVFVYDDKNRPRVWTPDFYIPKLAIYIEVCGSKKFNYEYRRKIYEKNECPVIFIHYYKERKKWKGFLSKRIEEIEALRHSKIMKMKSCS